MYILRVYIAEIAKAKGSTKMFQNITDSEGIFIKIRLIWHDCQKNINDITVEHR